jgi:hypothetical protein
MALRKNVKSQGSTVTQEISIDGGLLSRIEKISEQTGLNTSNLLQKWILQEESLIGLMRNGEGQTTEKGELRPDASLQQNSDAPDVQEQEKEEPAEAGPASPKYRKTLLKRALKLKEKGTALVKIAEIFNEEKLTTISGKGKWHGSSITLLLNSKI